MALLLSGLWFTGLYAQDLDELDALSDDATSVQTQESFSEEGGDIAGLGESEDLGGLGELEGSEELLDDDSEELSDDDDSEIIEESENSFNFGGYVKPLAYWQKVHYSDDALNLFQAYSNRGYQMPTKQESSDYTDLGARYQLTMEGFLGDTARFFSAVNLDQNEAGGADQDGAELNIVEAYTEIFADSRTWKIGSQLVTWGYMEGIEVPTDRLNARDFSYNSTEFEDSKMASTGILFQQALGDFSGLEIMLIPQGQRNIDPPLNDAFFPTDATDPKIPKSAFRYFNTWGDLDLSLSYVGGADPIADVETDDRGFNRRSYHREKSPGLDLQYNFGSFLGKVAYAAHLTEDEEGDDPTIKNNWQHWAAGVEVMSGASTINFYLGQKLVDDHQSETMVDQSNNFLLDQANERVDFISGHITANFLTGDALGTTVIFAGYWDEEGKSLQRLIKPTINYKVTDGLLTTFSPAFVDNDGTTIETFQAEVKYSF